VLEPAQLQDPLAGVWLPSAPGYAAPNVLTSWQPAPQGEQLTMGWDVIRWMEACLVHTEGQWAGTPFRLLWWEKRAILELFTLVPDPEWVPPPGWDGVRRFRAGLRRKYRAAFICLPKKNGKTELAAALALYLLIGDAEPSPKGVVAAGALHQAGLSFRACQVMLLQSPVLRMLASERDVGDLVIEIPSIPGSRLYRVAAEAGTNDGPSLHFAVLDEVHEWEGERGVNTHGVITNAGAARANPMFVSISTVGADAQDDTQVWVQLYNRGQAALEDPEADPSFYFLLCQAPEGVDWQDRTAWEGANPSAGATVTWTYYQEQWRKGEAWCERYYLNRPPGQLEDAWMDPDTWEDLAGDVVLQPGLPVYVAVRVGHDHQAAGVVLAQRQGGVVALRGRLFVGPAGGMYDAEEVEQYLLRLHDRYPAAVLSAERQDVRTKVRMVARPGPEVSFPGAFFETSAQRLRKAGLVLVDIPHSQERLVPAAETLLQLVDAGALVHDGDPELAVHVEAIVAKQADKGWRVTAPPGARRRTELGFAAMLAAHRAVTAQPAPSRQVRVGVRRG
jgi:phage terminase large subunit-like protein